MSTYYGKLICDQNGNYKLYSASGIINISEMLNMVYYHPTNNHIYIYIMDNPKVLFNEDGILYYSKIAPKTYTYHINGENLEAVLYAAQGKHIEITIHAEALEEIDYGETNYKYNQLLL